MFAEAGATVIFPDIRKLRASDRQLSNIREHGCKPGRSDQSGDARRDDALRKSWGKSITVLGNVCKSGFGGRNSIAAHSKKFGS